MAQKPLTKTQAKAAFLAQANHFTRLGTPNSEHSKLLLNSLAALFAAYTGEDIQVKLGWHDAPPVLAVTRPRPTEQQWGINWPEEPNSYRYFAVKSEWEACCFAHLVRKWLEREFANAKYHYETYPVLWESEFGDHAKNLAEHYDSLKAEIDQMTEVFEYEKIGYADKELKFYSFGEYFEELKLCVKNGNKKAFYPVFAHIIKSGEHGLETPTLRTIRDDIDQLLSVVETQPVTIAESAPVELVTIAEPKAPTDATYYSPETDETYPCYYKDDFKKIWLDRPDYRFWMDAVNPPHELETLIPCQPTPMGKVDQSDLIPRSVTTQTRPEPIESLSLTIRAESALVAASIKTIPELLEKTESDLLKLEGFGKKSLADVKTNLEQRGLTLGSAK